MGNIVNFAIDKYNLMGWENIVNHSKNGHQNIYCNRQVYMHNSPTDVSANIRHQNVSSRKSTVWTPYRTYKIQSSMNFRMRNHINGWITVVRK